MKILGKKRRQENKTNYTKRRRLLESKKPRVIIRKTNRYIILQYIESKNAQDFVKISVISKDLIEKGWPENKSGSLKSLGAAYLAGFLFGSKIKDLDVGILDTGLIRNTKGSRIYAALKGIVDSGVEMAYNKEVFPDEARMKNKIGDIFDKVKKNIGGSK